MCDETFRQACRDRGILPGVKVDTGRSPLPKGGGASHTEDLDKLGGRLAEYAAQGAAFAKWHAVIDIATISDFALAAKAHALGRYAALWHDHGIVPIVEPEVLCAGSHDLPACVHSDRTHLARRLRPALTKIR